MRVWGYGEFRTGRFDIGRRFRFGEGGVGRSWFTLRMITLRYHSCKGEGGWMFSSGGSRISWCSMDNHSDFSKGKVKGCPERERLWSVLGG